MKTEVERLELFLSAYDISISLLQTEKLDITREGLRATAVLIPRKTIVGLPAVFADVDKPEIGFVGPKRIEIR